MRLLGVLLRRPRPNRQTLAEQLVETRAERDALRATLQAVAGTAAETIPAELHAAATTRAHDGDVVRLAVAGREVIAVIGDEGGSPAEWWAAMRQHSARIAS